MSVPGENDRSAGHRRLVSITQGRLAVLVSVVAAATALVTAGVTVLVLGASPTPSEAGSPAWGAQLDASDPPVGSQPAGDPSTSLTAPTPSPTPSPLAPTTPDVPSPTSVASSSSAPATGTARLPSGILNLTSWKLTLPIGSSDKPQEITQPTLAGYSIAPYFLVNAERTGVVFQANAGGVTTSNSGYPRSELREMTAGGADEASWSTTSGTHTMMVREAITHLTVAKPQVTVAQIHDDSDDVLVVRLDGPHHLYAEHDGTDFGDLDNNYVLGTAFTVQFVATGGHVKIFYNGAQKVDYTKSSSGDYFKAGCYTQSNTSKGDAADAYAQVVIYGLQVTHTN